MKFWNFTLRWLQRLWNWYSFDVGSRSLKVKVQCYKNSLSHVCGIKIIQRKKLYHIIISISSFHTKASILTSRIAFEASENHAKRNINPVSRNYKYIFHSYKNYKN